MRNRGKERDGRRDRDRKKITERGLKIMSFMMPHTLRVCRVFRLS